MAGSPHQPKQAPLAGAAAHRRGQEAVAEAFGQLDYGEAPQIGVLGDTGCGKTTLTRHLIQEYLRRCPGSVFIVDDKEMTTRFEGQQRRDLEDLRARPVDYQLGRVIVFRGDVGRGQRVDVEEVAELAWARVGRQRKTLVVYDELLAGREETLCKNSTWRRGVKYVPMGFTMGRSPGVANIWGAQLPQDVPREVFDCSSAIFTFRLAGLGLQRLKERDYLAGGAGDVIPRLPGPPLPPSQRGVFVLLRRGQPWNGKLYKFEEG